MLLIPGKNRSQNGKLSREYSTLAQYMSALNRHESMMAATSVLLAKDASGAVS
eukprot:CAMPEP_0175114320 /NCGR_PEP_ID=MMETSP0086_2-20121207/16785_1 /TAXON_ID=136419 /ORGANISM="Unknown Unknown, Strain D1" /LENGTH=52 /DNA_ID=CAMNT_0016393945 /DNA_START=122 /DNA_END=276 /DNA_ORIENTATION=-